MSFRYKDQTIPTGGGTDFTTDDTLTMSQEQELSVTTPVQRIVTQAEYDALPEAERNKGLYVISDGGSEEISGVQEYDTEDGWHVRKWSDGYVELFKQVITEIPLSTWQPWGAIFSTRIGSFPLPFTLAKKYMENMLYANYDSEASMATLMICLSQSTLNPGGAYMDRTNYYAVWRPEKPTEDLSSKFNISVTGRWK